MMGGLSPLHWIIIIGVVLLLLGGGGKLSGLMGDAAKGIKAFREGLKDDHAPPEKPAELAAAEPPVKREEVKS
jgi:sec-independent protein translocase protein TatA